MVQYQRLKKGGLAVSLAGRRGTALIDGEIPSFPRRTAFIRAAMPEEPEGGRLHCAFALIAATTIAPSIVRVGQSTPETTILNVLEMVTTRTMVLNDLIQ